MPPEAAIRLFSPVANLAWDLISALPEIDRASRPPPPARTPDQSVDLVYTWVDSSDPKWQRRREAVAHGTGSILRRANTDDLFHSRDELRYSLRSVHHYAPWVRKVFVVTDKQAPSWLNAGYGKVELVDHYDIFPDTSVLPVFNSRAIESCLHRIPGLAKRFLYLNDDMLIGRAVTPTDFFDGDRILVRSSKRVRIDPSVGQVKPYMYGLHNAASLVESHFGQRPLNHVLDHAPYPLDRDLMAEIEDRFGSEFQRTREAPFRAVSDIQPVALTAMVALATARASLVETGRGEVGYVPVGGSTMGLAMSEILIRRTKFYCVNTTPQPSLSPKRETRHLRSFLHAMNPRKSPFEW